MTHYLIGIDDTDNVETRGTGHRVRQLAEWLSEIHVAEPHSITRHQLLVDPRIPYTSHNSSACLSLAVENEDNVWRACREFLLLTSADGSDVGLCLALRSNINSDVLLFGMRAKVEVLTMDHARETASRSGIRCEGLTGTGGGIIGSLAAIGLHRAGNDGRFLWLPGLRGLKGKWPVAEVMEQGHIERICTLDHYDLLPDESIDMGEWARPVLRNGKSTLYVEEHNHEWHILSKDRIKTRSN